MNHHCGAQNNDGFGSGGSSGIGRQHSGVVCFVVCSFTLLAAVAFFINVQELFRFPFLISLESSLKFHSSMVDE